MSDNGKPTLLVTGASGHLGQRVIELLLETNTANIIAATRSPEKLAALSQRGVTVRHADFDDPALLAKAFAGVDRLLLISTDALGVPGLRMKQHTAAVKAAEEAGVNHVVYTSLINPEPDSPIKIAPDHYATEIALTKSKLGYTVLRNNIYTDMLIGTISLALQLGGIYAASADGKIGYVTREDCARAAAAALTASFTGRRILDITGPAALSQYEVAAIASTATGQTITYTPLPLEVLVQNMVAAGLPQPVAEVYASFDAGTAIGKNDVVSNAVEQLTGRKPTSVTEFLTANRQAFSHPTAAH